MSYVHIASRVSGQRLGRLPRGKPFLRPCKALADYVGLAVKDMWKGKEPRSTGEDEV